MQDHPATGRYRLSLAQVLYEQQRLAAAADQLEQALEINPEFPLAQDLLGQCWEGLGMFAQAESAYRAAIALNLERGEPAPWPLYHLGSLLNDLGRIEAAVLTLESAVKADGSHMPALLELGIAMGKLDRLAEAAEALEAAAGLAPADARIHYALSGIYTRMKRDDKAAASITRFRELSGRPL